MKEKEGVFQHPEIVEMVQPPQTLLVQDKTEKDSDQYTNTTYITTDLTIGQFTLCTANPTPPLPNEPCGWIVVQSGHVIRKEKEYSRNGYYAAGNSRTRCYCT